MPDLLQLKRKYIFWNGMSESLYNFVGVENFQSEKPVRRAQFIY